MKVLCKSYNVLTIEIPEALTSGTPKIIGTNDDYEMIKNMTAKSGILRVKCTVGGVAMFGTCAVNPWAGADKLEATCLTYAAGAATGVQATIEPSDDGLKVTVTVAAI